MKRCSFNTRKFPYFSFINNNQFHEYQKHKPFIINSNKLTRIECTMLMVSKFLSTDSNQSHQHSRESHRTLDNKNRFVENESTGLSSYRKLCRLAKSSDTTQVIHLIDEISRSIQNSLVVRSSSTDDTVKVNNISNINGYHLNEDINLTLVEKYVVLLNAYATLKDFSAIKKLEQEIKDFNVFQDKQSLGKIYSTLWYAYIYKDGDGPEHLFRLSSEMKERKIPLSTDNLTSLIKCLLHHNRRNDALRYFRALKNQIFSRDKNVHKLTVIYHNFLKDFSKTNDLKSSLALMNEMKKERVRPNIIVFMRLLKTCQLTKKFHIALNLHRLAQRLLNMRNLDTTYFHQLYGALKSGPPEHVETIHNQLLISPSFQPDVNYFNTLLDVYSKHNNFDKIRQTFEQMKQFDVEPDDVTLSTLIHAFVRSGNMDKAMSVFHSLTHNAYVYFLHGSSTHPFIPDSTFSCNRGLKITNHTLCALMDGYGAQGNFGLALLLFNSIEKLNLKRTCIPYTILMKWYNHYDLPSEVGKLYHELTSRGIPIDIYAYNEYLRSFIIQGDHNQAIDMLLTLDGDSNNKNYRNEYDKNDQDDNSSNLVPDESTYTNIVDALIKAERFEEACIVFKMMKENSMLPSRILYQKLIEGLTWHDFKARMMNKLNDRESSNKHGKYFSQMKFIYKSFVQDIKHHYSPDKRADLDWDSTNLRKIFDVSLRYALIRRNASSGIAVYADTLRTGVLPDLSMTLRYLKTLCARYGWATQFDYFYLYVKALMLSSYYAGREGYMNKYGQLVKIHFRTPVKAADVERFEKLALLGLIAFYSQYGPVLRWRDISRHESEPDASKFLLVKAEKVPDSDNRLSSGRFLINRPLHTEEGLISYIDDVFAYVFKYNDPRVTEEKISKQFPLKPRPLKKNVVANTELEDILDEFLNSSCKPKEQMRNKEIHYQSTESSSANADASSSSNLDIENSDVGLEYIHQLPNESFTKFVYSCLRFSELNQFYETKHQIVSKLRQQGLTISWKHYNLNMQFWGSKEDARQLFLEKRGKQLNWYESLVDENGESREDIERFSMMS